MADGGNTQAPAEVLARTPANAKAGLQALYANGHILAPLANANPAELLTRYLSDESTKDIAASYGVTRQALGQFLLRHATEDWKDAQIARAIARKEKADDDLELAGDALSLARAREQLRSAQWDLERLLSRIYGQKSEVSGSIQVEIRRAGHTYDTQDAEVIASDPANALTSKAIAHDE